MANARPNPPEPAWRERQDRPAAGRHETAAAWVVAFVGPSGTGKSHRASLVALEEKVDLIIDDGLLIREGKVVAGRSAKREETRLGAVKCAIFADPAHAAEASRYIASLGHCRVLVLGTSDDMIDRILGRLGLPPPGKTIRIDEVATSEQIRRARRVRRQLGKHVIPAPTVAVKPTFSGYVLDPLKVFVRAKPELPEPELLEKSIVRPTYSSLGRFTIADVALIAIAAKACKATPGVSRVVRVRPEAESGGVRLTVELLARYGVPLPPALTAAQRAVKEAVEYMTALNVLEVNIIARGVTLKEAGPRSLNAAGPE